MKRVALGDEVFVHFLEHEILSLVGQRAEFGREAEQAFRMSLLIAERTVVPATAYWEEEWAAPLLEAYAPFRHAGRLKLMGTASDPEEYLHVKREQYARDPRRYQTYFEDPSQAEYERLRELWRTRLRSTTEDIAALWTRWLNGGEELFRRLLNRPGAPVSLDSSLAGVPEFLGTDAFIGDFAIRALIERGVRLDPVQEGLIALIIHRCYNHSWLDEIGATVVLGGPTRSVDALIEDADFTFDVLRFERMLVNLGLATAAKVLSAEQLLAVRDSVEWETARADLVARAGRRGQLWLPEESRVVKTARAHRCDDPVEAFRAVSERYTAGIENAARTRLTEEAQIERKRKAPHFEFHGGSHDFSNAQFGDRSGPTIIGGVSVTGGRLQIGGQSLDLKSAPAADVRRGIAELITATPPDDVVRQLHAVEGVLNARDDIVDAEIEEDIVSAYSGAREVGVTEHLKAVAGRISEGAVIGATSGGLTDVVLHALRALGLS